jgi:outer membrane biosynthesis protein TonB
MVWFTPVAVGVAAGRSAKVLALGEPPDGDFIQVRPTGSHDELSFSPNELTLDKPPRRPKAQEPEKKLALAPVPPSAPPHDELLVVRERPSRTKRVEPPAPTPAPAPEAPRTMRPTRGRAKAPAPLTVTLSSTSEGEWTVEVQAGSRRTVRPQPVSGGAVAAAARALGGDIEIAIQGALDTAREQQRTRVEQLEAELAAARQALDELA